MASLNPQQRQLVEQWAAEGANLNQIQDRLRSECAVTLTYMDTRLLIMELGVKIQEKPREKEPAPAPEPPAPPPQSAADVGDDAMDDLPVEDAATPPPAGDGTLKVTVDEIPPPGALVSGKATFTDGNTIQWFMDQMGQFGMRGPTPGYQPPRADIPAFQRELDTLLQLRGF